MKLKKESTEQKLRGGYYTPKDIAEFILLWGLEGKNKEKILEPSCGDGIFLETIKNNTSNFFDFTAVEFNKEEAEKCRKKVDGDSRFNILNNDFLKIFSAELKNKTFDLIIGNPPYIRYQYLTEEQKNLQSEILINNGMKSNKLINAWVSFLVASVSILEDTGKIGMVIPAELLQVAYAKDLRLFLTNNLSKITVVTFKELVFPDVQQEVVLFLAEKDLKKIEQDKSEINFIETLNVTSLKNDFMLNSEYKHINHTSDKWTKYFLSNTEIYKIDEIKKNKNFTFFTDIADVDVGITTGNNEFFSVTKDVVEKFDLQNVTLPLVGRSFHIDGLYFDKNLWNENIERGVRAFLLDFPNIPFEEYEDGHKNYILDGEKNDQGIGYKCSIRDRWYRIPSIWSPDAFLLRRSNIYPKFILNEIGAVSTDTMHRIRVKGNQSKERLLLSYYNSVTFSFIEMEARSYGGGVLEILPGEISNILILNPKELSDELVKKYSAEINRILTDDPNNIEDVLDFIDEKILMDIYSIPKNDIMIFRSIWHKLKNRRLHRK